MPIEKPPFVRQTLGDKPKIDSFAVRLNEDERKWLEEDKRILEQEKDSTALKQLALLGHFVLHDPKIGAILGVVFKNKRNNKRLGIVTYELGS